MMADAMATYITGGVWVVLFAAYALRVQRFGQFHSARVDGIGGTAVMGENIMQATYWAVGPVVRGFVAIGLTANGVTTLALVLGIGAGVSIALGYFGFACLLSTVSTICDILDGQVARHTNTGSEAGELFDAAVDRYTEFAFMGGFIVFARHSQWEVLIALLAMQASYMISYASAKAEALHVEVPRGLMRRHERAAILTLVAGFTPIFGNLVHERLGLPPTAVFTAGLLIVAVVGGVAGVLRFVWIRRALVRNSR